MPEEFAPDRAAAHEGRMVMPFYLLCDVSWSMVNDMTTLNNSIRGLRQAIVAEPIVDDVAQIGIISFADSARVVMPLGNMSEADLPQLSVEGGTDYGAAFKQLRAAIERDTAALKQQGYRVYRPCAFFLTDGEPLDFDWRQTFDTTLTYNRRTGEGMKSHPIFVPFGFRDAPEDVLRVLAYPPERGKWYLARTQSVESALKEITKVIMKTVITSAQSAQTGAPSVIQQKPGANSVVTQHDSDYQDDWI